MWVLACMLRPRHACDAGKHMPAPQRARQDGRLRGCAGASPSTAASRGTTSRAAGRRARPQAPLLLALDCMQ